MSTSLESLQLELNNLIQKIIVEAKREAASTQFSTSGNSGTSSLTNVQSNLIPKPDLKEHISLSLQILLKDKKEKNIISGFTMNPLKWTRNVNCWARNLDTTGISMGIWGLGCVGGGTLITRKHVLLANHVPYPTLPFLIYFVDNNNNSYEYKVIKTKRLGNTDILIGELDSEVHSSLKVYKILPSNYKTYLTSMFPVFYSDQERKSLIGELQTVYNQLDGINFSMGRHSDDVLSQYFEMLAVGDSGNSIFTLVNNELVLIGAWYKIWTNNTGMGTFLPAQIAEINNITRNSGYVVNEVDLSAFKNY